MINVKISAGVILLIAIGIIAFIALIVVFVVLKDRKKDKEEIDDLIGDLLQSKPRDLDILKELEEPKKPEVLVKQIDPVTNMEIKEDTTKPKVDLESMLEQMQKDLDAKREDTIEKFEKEQEEKAIISYQELVNNFEKEKLNQQILKETDLFEKEQEEEAIISYQDLKKPAVEPMELFEEEEPISNPLKEAIKKIESPREEQDKKFKNTEFISPIFGKMKEHLEYPKVKAFNKEEDFSLKDYFTGENSRVKNDYSYEIEADNQSDLFEKAMGINSLGDDIKKNDDFLQALKEFRSNL